MDIDILLAGFDAAQIKQVASVPWLVIGLLAFSAAVGVYNFLQMRKMQKKNQPKPNQLDGTIADEGTSFCDIAGSPHVHANITDIWGKSTQAIKKKSGGILGIGKTSQVTGYRYYAKFAAFIGNRIEKFLGINFDNRGWILKGESDPTPVLEVRSGNLFGENEGGVAGDIDIHIGTPNQEPSLEYQKYFPLVSGYPYQSYLLFRGHNFQDPFLGHTFTTPGFYLGNSGYMKEMLLWVKRTRVRNDGHGQWYPTTELRPFICEIGEERIDSESESDFRVFEISRTQSSMFRGNEQNTVYSSVDYDVYLSNNTMNYSFSHSPGAGTDGTGKELTYSNHRIVSSDQKLIFSVYIEISSNTESSFSTSLSGIVTTLEEIVISGISVKKIIHAEWDSAHPLLIQASTQGRGETGDTSLSINCAINKPRLRVNALGSAIDINPIHKIREILTDDTAMAKPETDVNDQNFMKAADRIWDEMLGVSWAIDEKSCIDAIEELCYHIEAGIRVNRQTGLYEMVLFRDDWFTEDEIHTIAENKIKDLSLEVMNSDDIVNQLNVTYYDRKRIKNSTFSVYENGSILTMGKANAESIDFPYFMNMRNAEIVANWKLKQYSTPAWKGTFTTGWREARKWNRYDLVEITWSKKWQGTILARIMKIDLGNGLNNEVMIDFEEVVPYSGEMNTSIVVDDSTEEKAEPAKPVIGETFEAPYYIAVQNIGQRKIDEELAYNQDVGFTFSTYRRPQWNALYAEITTANVDKPEDGWIVDGNAEFVTSGQFDQLVSRTMTQIPVKNLQIEGSLNQGDLIVVGSWIIGNVGQYEFMIIELFDPETSILTVKRGALDTIPFEWGVDTNFWLSNPENGLFSLTEYSADQNVRASALTVTPSSKLEQLGSVPVYIRSRAIRPYPPANVRFNDGYYPETIITTNDIVLTWLGRNRLDNQVIDYYDSSNSAETGTTYSYELISENVVLDSGSGITENTVTILSSSLIPNKPHTLKLWSVRDGYDSYQSFEHSFFAESASLILTASTDGSSVTGNTVPAANISVNVDESLSANMQFDGSAISGKAEAGATITIEIQE